MISKKIFLLIAFFLVLPMVFSFNLKTDKTPQEICQCISSAYRFILINDKPYEKTFEITSSNKEIEIVPKKLTVDGKSSKSFLVFLTPNCTQKKGRYQFSIKVTDNENNTKKFDYNYYVSKCREIEIKTEDINVCYGDPIKERVVVKNKGKTNENISVSLNNKLKRVTLSPQEEKTLLFNISDNKKFRTPGEFLLKGKVYSEDKFINKELKFKVFVKPCAKFEAKIVGNKRVCYGQNSTINITIKNIGRINDAITIESDDLKVKKTVRLKPNESKLISLRYYANRLGTKDIVLILRSQYGLKKKYYFSTQVDNCCKVSFVDKLPEIEICAESKAELKGFLRVKNENISSNFFITSDSPWIVPETKEIMLKNNEEKRLGITIRPLNKEGIYRGIIKVSNNLGEDIAHITLNVKKCYGLNVSMENIRHKCSDEIKRIPLLIDNTGESEETYYIKVYNPKELFPESELITLNPGQKGKVFLIWNKSKEKNSSKLIEVLIYDKEHPEIKKVIRKRVKIEKCHDFSMSFENLKTCANRNITLTGIIKNAGTKEINLKLKYLCPKWLKARTTKVFLKPNDFATVRLTGNVPVEASNKTILCSIIAKSEEINLTKTYNEKILVEPKDICFCTKTVINKEKLNVEKGKNTVIYVDITNCADINQSYYCNISENLRNYTYITPLKINVGINKTERCYYGFIIPPEVKEKKMFGNITIGNSFITKKIPIELFLK